MPKKIVLFRPKVKRPIYAYSKDRGAYCKEEGNVSEDYPENQLITIMGIPISLLYVAAPLVATGYEVKIIDEAVDPDYERHLEEDLKDALCVGITVVSAGYSIKSSLNFAHKVKQLTQVQVIWGGYHISALPEQSLADPRVDIAVFGEGEETMLEIVQALEQGRSLEGIKGCFYKKNGAIFSNPPRELIDLDALPPLPYFLLDIEKYIDKQHKMDVLGFFVLFTSRGCPNNCKFCATSYIYHRRWRYHKTETIISTIKFFVTNYKIKTFDFRDDNFFCSKSRVEEFCEALLKENLDIKWAATCRADYLLDYEPEFLALLKQSGLVFLHVGVEHSSDRMLEALDKGYVYSRVYLGLQKIEQFSKFIIVCSWLIGFPMETKTDVYETVKFISKLLGFKSINSLSLRPYISFPGSFIYNVLKAEGHKLPDSLEAWSDIDNIPLIMPKEYGKFYIALTEFMPPLNELRRNRSPLINAWLSFRLWLVYKLKWDWTLYGKPDIALIEFLVGLKHNVKKMISSAHHAF
jgi:anaerobic magnesium-protoporphyrin IX monomethyl ester cyclase